VAQEVLDVIAERQVAADCCVQEPGQIRAELNSDPVHERAQKCCSILRSVGGRCRGTLQHYLCDCSQPLFKRSQLPGCGQLLGCGYR